MYKKVFVISISLFFIILSGCTGCTRIDEVKQSTNSFQENITLVFYNLFDSEDAFKGQIQEFESEHPKIKIQYEKFTNPKEYEELLINELAEGKGPDLFTIHNTWLPKHYGKLATIPMDLSIPINPDLFRQVFFNIAAEDLIIENQIYGLPLGIDSLALYYNKEYFISSIPGTNQPADTWEKLKKQVINLTKKDKSIERFAVSGIALGRSDNIINAIDILYLMMLTYETKLYDQHGQAIFAQKQGTLEGGQAFNPGVKALELYTSFSLPSYNNYSWNDALTGMDPERKDLGAFVRGKTAMIFGYSYFYDEIQRTINDYQKTNQSHIELKNIGIVASPQVLDPATTNKRVALGSYFPLVVSKNSAHQRAAWEFAMFLTSKNSLQTYFEITHKPAARLDLQEEQSLDPIYGAFARQAKYAKSYKILDQADYIEIFTDTITDVINTTLPQSALNKAEKKVNCLLGKKNDNPQYKNVDCLDLK